MVSERIDWKFLNFALVKKTLLYRNSDAFSANLYHLCNVDLKSECLFSDNKIKFQFYTIDLYLT